MTDIATEGKDVDGIRAELSMHTGSLERYCHWTQRIIYTPGVRHLAERAEAFWLIDLIASHQLDPKVAAEEFQFWTLTVAIDRKAVAAASDGNESVIVTQDIEFTTFPLAKIELYVVDGTLMLPSEY